MRVSTHVSDQNWQDWDTTEHLVNRGYEPRRSVVLAHPLRCRGTESSTNKQHSLFSTEKRVTSCRLAIGSLFIFLRDAIARQTHLSASWCRCPPETFGTSARRSRCGWGDLGRSVSATREIVHGRIPEVSAATAWSQNIMQLLIAVTAPRQTVTVEAGQSQAGALL